MAGRAEAVTNDESRKTVANVLGVHYKTLARWVRAARKPREPIEGKERLRWLTNLISSTERLGDPSGCVHIGDRESDIYELFCAADEAKTRYLVRTCVNRRAGRDDTTRDALIACEPIRGTHTLEVRTATGETTTATLQIRFRRRTVHPPVGKKDRYPALMVTVVDARERGTPRDRKRIHWKLMTNMEVIDLASAIEKFNWYALRWKIETYHKVLKSGCQAEQLKLRTAERLTNLLAVFCVIGWRVFWLTMSNRVNPDAPAETALTKTEIEILDRLVPSPAGRSETQPPKHTVSHYLVVIAKLGGYVARSKDPPPGNMVLWRGITRLTDIHLGYELHNRVVGN